MKTREKGLSIKDRDPVLYEILQHRLQCMTEEAATALQRVSASPVATQIGDMNIGVFDAAGENVAIGQFSVAKATGLSEVIKDILEAYPENPGINPGDAFLANDPYLGIMHQNDVCLLLPVFADGELIAWTGADIHQVDVGGPTPGQVQLGAKDIFGEAPLIPPIKVMEDNVIRVDVERCYLRNCRVPNLVALDLRAKLAACRTLERQIHGLLKLLGAEGLRSFFESLLEETEILLRHKLRKIPDGAWAHRNYLEFDEACYGIVVAVRKQGDSLIIDFTGTDKQAPATVNMTEKAVKAWLAGNLCDTLLRDIPWHIGGLNRVFTLVTEPGTLVNPTFPAGVSKSTTSIGLLMSSTVKTAISKMLSASDELSVNASAGWPGGKAQEEIHGINQHGKPYAADILDGMAGGGGAMSYQDGVDTGGLNAVSRISIANVEAYEQRYPILYLYRCQLADSGGAGRFRGGNGIDRAYVVHGADSIPDVVLHSVGAKAPITSGLEGGHPSSTNQFIIKRQTTVPDRFAEGVLPAGFDEILGEALPQDPLTRTSFGKGDVYRAISVCGGGFGDPLQRDPAAVATDVELGLVSPETTVRIYGVVLDYSGAVCVEATEARRKEIAVIRSAVARAPLQARIEIPLTRRIQALNASIFLGEGEDGGKYLFLDGAEPISLCPAEANYKDYLPFAEYDSDWAGSFVDRNGVGRELFHLWVGYHPITWRQIVVEVKKRTEAPLKDVFLQM